MEKVTVLKFVGLVIGLLAKFVTGSIFVFNVYQDKIKQTFNYTQKEGNVNWMTNLSIAVVLTVLIVSMISEGSSESTQTRQSIRSSHI